MPRPRRSNPTTMHRAGELRKELTPAERKLWAYLRGDKLEGINFRRQHAIGNYIADFCSPKARLIIELDGSQHLEQEEYDEERTKYLEKQGYKVIRFWNKQVMNDMNGVILAITNALNPHPSSPKFDDKNLGNDENPPVEFGGGAR
jgi:very-short-patch-repair endonuclease